MFAVIQKWHKKIGIFAVLFLIFLTVSGIFLNHSETFGLNRNFVQAEWLLDIYNIQPPSKPVSYQVDALRATQVGTRLYVNQQEIANPIEKLLGIVKLSDYYVVAYDHQLLLITTDAQKIELLSGTEGVPSGMKRIGIDNQQQIVIEAAHGFYIVDLDVLQWDEQDHYSATWSEPSPLPDALETELLRLYRGSGLSIERILLDFHSGRIVGSWGVYFVDIIALLLLFIAMTGIWM